jgi:hypothetical protein
MRSPEGRSVLAVVSRQRSCLRGGPWPAAEGAVRVREHPGPWRSAPAGGAPPAWRGRQPDRAPAWGERGGCNPAWSLTREGGGWLPRWGASWPPGNTRPATDDAPVQPEGAAVGVGAGEGSPQAACQRRGGTSVEGVDVPAGPADTEGVPGPRTGVCTACPSPQFLRETAWGGQGQGPDAPALAALASGCPWGSGLRCSPRPGGHVCG